MNNMDMNNLTKDMKDTAKKAKYMAKEVAEDVKDNFEGAMNIMEAKKDEMMDRYEQKKFAAEIKNQMKKENK
ncbi:hypothetical protein [Faecalimicrobium dakarense]|uniref:hypothetical protein n=1 Tax=Faecalimicrobium dakarense TaxID=1301100 RepID=UPI0004B1B1E2|nr:hypothetical protein [[Clostridium] dakarense]